MNDVAAALADPQAVAREAIVEISHPVLGTVREVASPLRFDDFEPPAERGPFRGENTAEILSELCGYTEPQIAELVRDGVLGDLRPRAVIELTRRSCQMRIDVTMPNLGYDMETGTVQAWLKSVGDTVKRGEPIAEIETDKTTVEMEAMASGTLVEIVCEAGAEAAVGAVIAVLESGD